MPYKNPEYQKAYYEANKEKMSAYKKAWNEANKEKVNAYKKAWNEANKEKKAAAYKAYYEANKEKRAAQFKAYYEANKEKRSAQLKAWREANKEKKAALDKAWREANKDRVNAHRAKRRAAILQRTPGWLTEEDFDRIRSFYTEAQKKKEETGEEWHVDHIIPLQGELVSGLHVPENLQVIKATDNRSKHNNYTL